MDISIIDHMRIGRKDVETYWVKESMMPRIIKFIENELKNGGQAYIVTPLIEESDKMDFQNAVDLYQQLSTSFSIPMKMGLLHGLLSNQEKVDVTAVFINNKCNQLMFSFMIYV